MEGSEGSYPALSADNSDRGGGRWRRGERRTMGPTDGSGMLLWVMELYSHPLGP